MLLLLDTNSLSGNTGNRKIDKLESAGKQQNDEKSDAGENQLEEIGQPDLKLEKKFFCHHCSFFTKNK